MSERGRLLGCWAQWKVHKAGYVLVRQRILWSVAGAGTGCETRLTFRGPQFETVVRWSVSTRGLSMEMAVKWPFAVGARWGTTCGRRKWASAVCYFRHVWPAGRPRHGCCARRRADLRSAQLPHSGCCGACPATCCGWRAPEWGGSSLRSSVLDGKGQLEGQDGAMLNPSRLGIPDGPERDYQSTP